MKIADRTPFRNDSGQIDIFGRIQGTLRFGLSWYDRLRAQDTVIAVLDKILGPEYYLLRNVTLPDTDIDLPLVLIGPPGVYLINVTHERGVYRARDDEWGTVSGEKFVPAGINQVQRAVKLGRVLQLYLDRAGYKDAFIVDPILMAADPGMHIESVRPAARIVMSDALERFAISMTQTRPIFTLAKIVEIARVIVKGPKAAQPTDQASAPSTSSNLGSAEESSPQAQETNVSFSPDTLGFSFDEQRQDRSAPSQPPSTGDSNIPEQNPGSQSGVFRGYDDGYDNLHETGSQFFESTGSNDSVQPFSDLEQETASFEPARPESQPDASATTADATPKKSGLFGMSTSQVLILGAILLFWLCAMAGFAIFLFLNR